MSTAYSLRPTAHADREFLWQLHRDTMRDYVERTWGWDDAWQRSRFDESFSADIGEIIEVAGQPIGQVIVQRPGDEIFLQMIEIAPSHQGRGIGTQIICALMAEAERSGMPFRLQVLRVNPARQLYERLGLQEVGETATHYLMKREPGGKRL